MGQTLPLPRRIPAPDDRQLIELTKMGIIILDKNVEYVRYSLPDGWKMVDDTTYREDLPVYHIIDDNSRIKVTISGVWKVLYDNELRMSIPYDDKLYTEVKKRTVQPYIVTSPMAVIESVIETTIEDMCDRQGKLHKD